ncbi:phosphatidate cytidylyltransferase [Marinimicrobium sp. ABcell2]|uniref:phosphatidate cytidylyltransferase n=1 Tax=Marinimicrobium sp. ABcell2 TaxID=3069751 RepID=UPI0027B01417|nr:phosphatidate cytidylyltransferase [Marinimicrobium sp. ABcell2]MDQ2077799.1 phosphatidate cytidylyltransferase [Marinimicrobium sp. ABcell2]
MIWNDLPTSAISALGGVFALLVIASAVSITLKQMRPDKNYLELRQRVRSWWLMIALVFAALLMGKGASTVFFAFLSFLALKEFLSIVPTRLTDRRVLLWLYLAIPIHYYWVYAEWYGMFIIFIPVYLFLFIPTRMLLVGETDGFIRSAASYHWAAMTTVFCLSHIAYLLVLPASVNPAGGAIGLVLYLLFLTQFNDVAQYIWGKTLGKRKIAPLISPNKTWGGFLGGLFTTMVAAALLAEHLTPLNWLEGLIAGAIIAPAGFIGDLTMSAVKRDLKIKDTSQLIPGHGGILDRLDSLIYASPLFFHYLYYLKY